MSCSNSVRIVLFLLPVLISCETNPYRKVCKAIDCARYKSDKKFCSLAYHVEDPFSNECVAKCDSPCVNRYCIHCYCYFTSNDAIMSTPPSDCKRVLNGTACTTFRCLLTEIRSCSSNYIINPYDKFECVQRCDEHSCGEGGTCSLTGYCVCHLGYRPDIMNPRICLKIPEDNTTKLERTCHKGFKLSEDGECVSACDDCKNGCCGTDGVCHCWDSYELDVATSTCVSKRSCSDRCLSSVCDSDGVCQCPDCSDSINKRVNCQAGQNDTVYDVGGLDADYNCGNTSLSEDMISKTKHKTSIAILLSITMILLITIIVLVVIFLKIKRELPENEGRVQILFGGNFNVY